ncbi:MAG: nitrilase-related carbon-nitrogen hydrolase [Chloroflexota bacterium]|nr:beta-ureidopropionase [Chloroflexota bacterium]
MVQAIRDEQITRCCLRVVVAQYHPKKGDYAANIARIGDIFEQLGDEKVALDILTLPETATSGYFLEGGVREVARRKEHLFGDLQQEYLKRRGLDAPLLDITLGYYEEYRGAFYNSALYATLGNGRNGAGWQPGIVHNHRKFFLPTYGVFDEERFVSRGRRVKAFETRFGLMGMLVCEDAWHSLMATLLALQGTQVIFIGNASPARHFEGKEPGNVTRWRELVEAISSEHNLFVVLTNLCGFEGGKGFIGASVVTNPFGEVILDGPLAKESLLRCELNLEDIVIARGDNPLLADLETGLPDLIAELQEIGRG